jgi:serine protease inhibitor
MQIGQQKKSQTDHDPMQKCAASWYITNKIQKSPYTTTNTSLLLYLPKKYNLPQPPQKMERERESEEKGARKIHLRETIFFYEK